MNKTSIITSLALGSLVAIGSAHAGDSNPYAAKSMQNGHQQTSTATEGKCGEGKCGGTVKKPVKAAEGKCGEGKCGGSK